MFIYVCTHTHYRECRPIKYLCVWRVPFQSSTWCVVHGLAAALDSTPLLCLPTLIRNTCICSYRELVYDEINVDVIHADRTRQQRDEIIAGFRKGKIWVLICTDLMARGIDFKVGKKGKSMVTDTCCERSTFNLLQDRYRCFSR